MSLNIILASANGIIIAADRRVGSTLHLNRVDPELYGISPNGRFFYDGMKKILFYQAPHNYVAFAYSGDGSLDSEKLITGLESLLPPHRLTIKEYAETLIKLFLDNPSNFKYPNIEFGSNDSNNIYVIGYNKNSNNAFTYHVNLPHRNNPNPVIEHLGGLVISGIGKYIEDAQSKFINEWIKRIENRITGAQITGQPVSQLQKVQLRELRNNKLPLANMQLSEMVGFAEFAINYTVGEQIRRNEEPSVGGGIDILYLTKTKGVEVISYEQHFDLFERPLAKTNYHHLILKCCGQETKMQMDFAHGNILGKSHIRYPSNGIFECPKCKTKHNLRELRIIVEKAFKAEIVIE